MSPEITAQEILDLIKIRAHELWEHEGKPDGKHEEHWLAAQQEVMEEVDRSGATGLANPVASMPRSRSNAKRRQEDLVDEAIEETFPASDPISPKRIT